MSLIECVPNFSEARRPEVVEAIRQSIAGVEGIHVLDQHADHDHNRTVITFVGPPAAVEEAAFRGVAKAAELIDLNQHEGEHPRIGATDVVPFIPISGASIQDCVEIAQRLGRRVADELDIPVYLYEEAASSPERRNLAFHRKGEYETLREVIASDPERAPDFGPKRLGPAGATVIGAREFLIAFNVYLTSDDVSIAKKIAKTVRHSSGGLRYVKALGLLVESRAQVSMNLTNFRKTPIALVVETIRREAQRYGVAIHHSELVGLIPQDALVDAAVWYTQLDQFEPEQVLERRLYAAGGKRQTADDGQRTTDHKPFNPAQGKPPSAVRGHFASDAAFLHTLASGTPTPGGGSAAAYAGAMGAALVAMVARLTLGRKKYAAVEAQMQSVLEEAETLRADLTATVERDAAAFDAIMTAFKRPKDDPERAGAIQDATLHAAEVPLETARMAVRVMELALEAVTHGNKNAITDGATGASLAQAALQSAGYNVRVNVLGLKDKGAAENMLAEVRALEEQAADVQAAIAQLLAGRGGMAL